MATDKRLLSIMQEQGLGTYVSMMQLQRGDRVGINSFLMKLIMHAALLTGSIKFYVGKCHPQMLLPSAMMQLVPASTSHKST